jgi:penicillin amidase
MKGWDGRLEPASRAAALAVGTLRATGERVITARVSQVPLRSTLARRTAAIHKLLLERPPSWAPAGDWDAVLRGAWLDATADLERRLGADRAQWRWGAANRIAVGHPLSRAVAPLAHLFNPPVAEVGGFSTTPNVLGIAPSGAVEGPSMRFIADLADPDQTRLVNFMGQSGHPASEHYSDQFDPWVKVETRRLPFTQEAVAKATRHTLKLVP